MFYFAETNLPDKNVMQIFHAGERMEYNGNHYAIFHP